MLVRFHSAFSSDTMLLRGVYRCICTSKSDIKQFIIENTEIVCDNTLTPEIRLSLFTPKCRFWHARPDTWPFSDPYWAIYWPGGQALSRLAIKRFSSSIYQSCVAKMLYLKGISGIKHFSVLFSQIDICPNALLLMAVSASVG